METQIKKEERSESVFIYVTPTLKKEFEHAKDNQVLKETIIKQFLTNEKDWLNDELRQIDESVVKYSAKLIGIKDAFGKCQNAYIEEIETIYKKANETFKKLDLVAENTNVKIERTRTNLYSMLESMSKIDFSRVERMLSLVEKLDSMSQSEMDLLRKLLIN